MIALGQEVTLTEAEQELCKMVAKMRSVANRESGVTSRKMFDAESDLQIDIQGYGAELAFAKMCNVYPDFTTHIRSSRVDVGDVILKSGLSVDVKHTTRLNGNLITPSWKCSAVDLYALLVGIFPKYIFRGGMPKERFLCEHNLKDLRKTGKLDTFVVFQKYLEELTLKDIPMQIEAAKPVGILFVPLTKKAA